ncbi:glycosyltransferase family 4 protein [Spirosoma pollinicola]|uniref:Group 1 glycosyl transferase n=1 Tax=Spirosoma pollinicola TaxID=2057025 RepID=A0A2K8YYA1_9BACT|nr:glycosyltransferase family 4 protein [Spirosoma pollinicola]AUD02601.1 group 1 glycosyl transferase [Spirosoma pollinicola]
MNVLIATYLSPTSPSGVVTSTNILVNDLTSAGVNVHMVDATNTPVIWRKCLGVLKRLMRPLGGAFYVVYDEFAYFTGIYLSTRKLRQSHFDLIHAQDVRSGVAAWMALGRNTPVVLTCHFNDDPVHELVDTHALKSGFTKQLTAWYRYLFSHVKNYLFGSEYAYIKSKHLLPGNINKLILPNSVRLNAPVNAKETANPTETGKLIICNVGYIDERKNQQLLLQIGRELIRRGTTNFHIRLIGDGPKRAEYTQMANQFSLTDYVTFYGQQAEPWRLVAQSDLYIHTSLNDNCPYSLIESFAVGTPVLALPVGGIPEMLPDGAGALHGATVVELTDEVLTYFDAEKRQQLARVQSAYAAKVFDSQINLDKMLSFYRQLLGEPAPAVAHLAPVS